MSRLDELVEEALGVLHRPVTVDTGVNVGTLGLLDLQGEMMTQEDGG